jgi:hypothetical protein
LFVIIAPALSILIFASKQRTCFPKVILAPGLIATIGLFLSFGYVFRMNQVTNKFNKINIFSEILIEERFRDFVSNESKFNFKKGPIRVLSQQLKDDKNSDFKISQSNPILNNTKRHLSLKFLFLWHYFFAMTPFWFCNLYLGQIIINENK